MMKTGFLAAMLAIVTGVTQLLCQPDTVRIGAYVRSLYDFDLATNTVKSDVYYWCSYKNREFDFSNEFELLNANAVSLSNTSVDTLSNGKYLFYAKASAHVRQNYELTDYPFDSQRFVISVESSEYDEEDLIFRPDKVNCKLDPSVQDALDEWEITNTSFDSGTTTYESNFGNPIANPSSPYSRFDVIIELQRKDSMLILFKLITGILVAFIISSCVFFIKPINTDPRFGLCVGALFAAIGNKYIVESIVPATNKVSMLDNLHNLTFVYIFIMIVISVISLHIYEKGSDEDIRRSQLLDRWSLITVVTTYGLGVLYLVGRELQ